MTPAVKTDNVNIPLQLSLFGDDNEDGWGGNGEDAITQLKEWGADDTILNTIRNPLGTDHRAEPTDHSAEPTDHRAEPTDREDKDQKVNQEDGISKDKDIDDAEFGRKWREAFTRDPKSAIMAILNALPDTEKKEIIETLTEASADATSTEEDEELPDAVSDFEEKLIPYFNWVRTGEKRFTQAIQSVAWDLARVYGYATAVAQVLQSLVSAYGANIDVPRIQDVEQLLIDASRGKGDFEQLIKDRYGKVITEVVKKKIAATGTKKPESLVSAGNSHPTELAPLSERIKSIHTMYDAWRLAGEIMNGGEIMNEGGDKDAV